MGKPRSARLRVVATRTAYAYEWQAQPGEKWHRVHVGPLPDVVAKLRHANTDLSRVDIVDPVAAYTGPLDRHPAVKEGSDNTSIAHL